MGFESAVLKNLLVALDSSTYASTAAKFAIYFAKKFNAKLSAIHVIDSIQFHRSFVKDLSTALNLESLLSFDAQLRKIAAENGKNILNAFSEYANKDNIEYDTIIKTGVVSNEILDISTDYDMVFIGKKGVNAAFEREILGSNIESIIRKIKKPLFVSDQNFYEIKNIIVGFDTQEKSKKAIELSMMLSEKLSSHVSLVHVGKEKPKTYNLDVICLEEKYSVADTLIDYAKSIENSILVLGTYSKNPFLEMILGSTTESVLRKNASIPFIVVR